MRTERNNQEGTSTILEHPKDLAKLTDHLRKLVPPSARELFAEYPRSLRDLATRCRSPAQSASLRELSTHDRCELQIHKSGSKGQPLEVYVCVGRPSTVLL